MKKTFLFVLILSFLLASAGCQQTQQSGDENGQDYFDAEVLELRDGSVLAECLSVTSGVVSPGTEAEVSTDVISANGVPELAVGDSIRVVFGAVEDSIPLQLGTVFAIYLLDEDGTPISPE